MPYVVADYTSLSSVEKELRGILRIVSASCGRNIFHIISSFQVCKVWSIRHDTWFPSWRFFLGLMGLECVGIGIHLSSHILTLLPFPMFHRAPSTTISLAAIMLLHAKEGWLPNSALRNVECSKYLALKTWWKSVFWFCRSRHPCFARRDKLKAFKSLNPIPSSAFGLQSLSQAINGSFLSSFFCPHQNRLIMASSSLHNESDSLKQLIEYVSVAWAIALISVSLPA